MVLFVNAARYGYTFGTDVLTVLDETDDYRRRLRMAALAVHVEDHRVEGR